MGQVSSKLRRADRAYFHWCPACEELHPLWDSWKFDGNLECPTFDPSFRQGGAGVKGGCCHYTLVKGVLDFQKDCTHSFAGKKVPLPDLPFEETDAALELK